MSALALLLGLTAPVAIARIGEAPATVIERLADYAPVPAAEGDALVAASDFEFSVHDVDGVTVAVSGEGALNDANIRFLGSLVGAASGYGDGIAGPVADFFRSRAADLRGIGEVPIEVVDYLMHVQVEEGEPDRVSVRLVPDVVDEALFGEPAQVLGSPEARYVIREYTDLQCPFCAAFAAEGMPLVEELVAGGDVRFELHHFPLKSIHPNAAGAAEAAECVAAAAEGDEDAFWVYQDALFEQQARWSGLPDPVNTFVAIATEAGLPAEGLALCVRSGTFTEKVEAGYRSAVEDLRLTGTPSVFVDGLKLGDYRSMEEYQRLMRLSDALEATDAP